MRAFAAASTVMMIVMVLAIAHGYQPSAPPISANRSNAAQSAPAGYDNNTIDPNFVSQKDFDDDLGEFDQVDQPAPDGLGPVYNAQACRECHQDPVSGAASQIVEQRAGHLEFEGRFFDPIVHLDEDGPIEGRNLINDRAIVRTETPTRASKAQERVPEGETIRTNRISLNVRGDGFVEAIPDATILGIRKKQCDENPTGGICGVAIWVPVVEANVDGVDNEKRLGRFGWKDQHASLLSFSADAYLNEMGITNRLQPLEVTQVENPSLCRSAQECKDQNKVSEPNNPRPGDPVAKEDIDKFAEFMRATKAPPRDPGLQNTPAATQGQMIFDRIHCNTCHVDDAFFPNGIVTSAAGTRINAGKFTVPAALGSKKIEPFSDFLLHDVGTGDNVAIAGAEHYNRDVARQLRELETLKRPRLRTLVSQFGTAQAVITANPNLNFDQELRTRGPNARALSARDLGSLADFDITSSPLPDPNRAAFPFNRPFFQRDECDAHRMAVEESSPQTSLVDRDIQCTANKLRTAPLWGLHARTRLLHDGNSVQLTDAILRHQGEATPVTEAFKALTLDEKNQLLVFLKSL